MRRFGAVVVGLILALFGVPAAASFETYVVEELYSNADGTVQYVVLHEAQGSNQQDVLLGQTLTATHAGVTQTFVFDHNLPSRLTAGKRVLIATAGFVARNAIMPDYVMPNRFLPVDGGTVNYAGVDQLTYAALPTDGFSALYRNGATTANVATNFAGAIASVPPLPVTAVEFYNPQLDHYFVSAFAADIDALDTGRIPGWYRTGQTFRVYPTASANGAASPVCRFYIPPPHGDSHFLSASPAECAAVAQRVGVDPDYSGYILETPAAFYILLPDPVSGACSTGAVPVYRLWNHRADSNHRYVVDPAIKAQMIALGYTAEGYGPDAVAMCAAPGESAVVAQVSGTSPFAAGCDNQVSTDTLYLNTEVEPRVEIDPSDPNHLIGVWQQDRWSDGGARGLLTGVSFDAGRSWSTSRASFSRCTGGNPATGTDFARASDPWITISPDGTAYQIGIAFTGPTFGANAVDAVLVSRSTDGGRTWGTPTTLIRDARTAFNDKESITADPADSRFVYAVWDRLLQQGGGPTWFARTVDGGASWEPARNIYDPGGSRSQTLNNQVLVLPDGTLVDFFTQFDTDSSNNTTARLAVIRSADHGTSWSAPIFIGPSLARGTVDPDTGAALRDGANLGSVSVGRNGHIALAWQDSRFSGGVRDAIAFSQSVDGGLTWSAPVRINAAPNVQAFVPTVKVRDDGVIGVTYYDFRNNTPDPASLPTDYWLTQSSDGIAWRETHVAGPFDLSRAPNARGLFLGDYQGLTSTATSFVPFWAQATADPVGATSIFAGLPALAANALKSTTQNATIVAAEPAGSIDLTPAWRRALTDAAVRTLQSRLRGGAPPRAQ